MAALIPQKMFDEQLAAMDIENFAQATIRQVGAVGGALEKNSGTEFLHLEMGVPGLPPETVGVEAEQQALAQGHASIYPSITGIAPLKSEASRFVKAFLDIDVAPEGCIPTVGSMQGGFCLFQICSQCDPKKDTILFIDPGFPVQRQQVRILGIKHESFDIYDFRAEKLGPKLESYLKQGNVAAIIYSNPNNPAYLPHRERAAHHRRAGNQVRHDRSRRLGLHGHGLPQGAGTSFPGSVPGHRSPLYG